MDRPVRRSGDDYGAAFLSLLPTGPAWPRDADSVLIQLVYGLGQAWGDVDARAADLRDVETDPRLTLDLLADWERAFGLPEVCGTGASITAPTRFRAGVSQVGRDRLLDIDETLKARRTIGYYPSTIPERREALIAKMTR